MLSDAARTLICRLLVHNPRQRLTIGGALDSTWIVGDWDKLEALYVKQALR